MGSKKRQVIGIKYYLGLHMVLCHSSENLTINQIACGERLAWSGTISSSSTIRINKPEMFGGVTKEGGVKGYVDILMGGASQAKNSYLVEQLSSAIPAFRGVVSFVAKQIYCTAGSPYIKNWWIQITSIVQGSWYSSKANINSGSANAAHMIRECLTNNDWGMGIDVSELTDTAFRDFADTIYDEGLGLSMLLVNQGEIDKFIQEILKHVQGVIYTDKETGKYVIKLIRKDYVISGLLILNESNIVSVESYDKPSPGELLDEVIIKYRPRGLPKDAAAAFQNLASVESQNGIISKTVSYPGIDKHSNAAKIAAREMRQQSAQLSKVKLIANREAYSLNIGDVFRFSWDEFGISLIIMRIVKINYGQLDSPNIIIDAVEDVFALSKATYLEPVDTSWVDPLQDPSALLYNRIEEMNWWDIINTFDPANTALIEAEPTASFITYLGIQNEVGPGFELWTRVGTILEPEYDSYAEYVPDAFLVNDLNYTDNTSISISNLDTIEVQVIRIGQYAIIDDEYIRIDDIDEVANTIDIGRGCLDTIPAEHSAGTRIWFAEENMARSYTDYAIGITVRAQALVETGLGRLGLDPINEDTILVDGRQNKPYIPGRFFLNGVNFPEAIPGEELLVITWAHRDRLQQTVTVIAHDFVSIGPEAGTTYEINLYDENDVLRRAVTGLTGTTYTWTTEVADSLLGRLNSKIRIELKTVRGGVDSWQSYNYTVDRAGYGFNYGYYYGGI